MAIIFHIDVNSAFLSWTAAATPVDETHPDLRNIPSIIGGDAKTRHGIVLAKSTPAKAFGIQTAEPVASALKKCPGLVVVPPDHTLYSRRSQELMDLLRGYTPDIEQVSVDECYMDFTPIAHRFDSPVSAADQIRKAVLEHLGFTVNVGISVNRLLAKMASDFTKPNRTHTLFPEEIPSKMWPLPVDDLFMVGRSSAGRLHELGIHTIGDLAGTDLSFLEAHFKSHGRTMYQFANGIASDRIRLEKEAAKGIGNSTTVAEDVITAEAACKVLLRLSQKVAGRLRSHQKKASCVTVEIKYADFVVNTHQALLPVPVDDTSSIYEAARDLFFESWNGNPIRLFGVRTTHLTDSDAPVQMTLFDLGMDNSSVQNNMEHINNEMLQNSSRNDKGAVQSSSRSIRDSKRQKAEQAADRIRQRYGNQAIMRGALLDRGKKKHQE